MLWQTDPQKQHTGECALLCVPFMSLCSTQCPNSDSKFSYGGSGCTNLPVFINTVLLIEVNTCDCLVLASEQQK